MQLSILKNVPIAEVDSKGDNALKSLSETSLHGLSDLDPIWQWMVARRRRLCSRTPVLRLHLLVFGVSDGSIQHPAQENGGIFRNIGMAEVKGPGLSDDHLLPFAVKVRLRDPGILVMLKCED